MLPRLHMLLTGGAGLARLVIGITGWIEQPVMPITVTLTKTKARLAPVMKERHCLSNQCGRSGVGSLVGWPFVLGLLVSVFITKEYNDRVLLEIRYVGKKLLISGLRNSITYTIIVQLSLSAN